VAKVLRGEIEAGDRWRRPNAVAFNAGVRWRSCVRWEEAAPRQVSRASALQVRTRGALGAFHKMRKIMKHRLTPKVTLIGLNI
jgi:hypothetical protein